MPEPQTLEEFIKKWSDFKQQAKRRISAHSESVRATVEGEGIPGFSPLLIITGQNINTVPKNLL